MPHLTSSLEPNLSPRQRQILELIRQGKSNNEIAFELGIGLGTVKQHVVALFRKLKVSKRTMALSRGNEQAARLSQAMSFSPSEVILQRRPCIVLSMTLATPSNETLRKMKTAMAVEAQETGDIFLPWRDTGCDVILGIEQATESAPLRALQIAWKTAGMLADTAAGSALKGGLAAGLAVASMHRRGGWSGEAIASSAIVLARQHALAAEPGMLNFDASIVDLLHLCGAYLHDSTSLLLPLKAPEALQWHDPEEKYSFHGRRQELDRLENMFTTALQSPRPGFLSIVGGAGIGKSRLCAQFIQFYRQAGHAVRHFRCLPANVPLPIWDVHAKNTCTWEGVQNSLPDDTNGVLIIDDAHWLTEKQKNTLLALHEASQGVLCLVERRQTETTAFVVPPLSRREIEALTLEAIPVDAFTGVSRAALSRCIAALADGNPLFALEMARHRPTLNSLQSATNQAKKYLPLNLSLLVTANLDQTTLDRRMLEIVASRPNGIAREDLTRIMGEEKHAVQDSVDEAVTSDVLSISATGCIGFVHPMFHKVINHLGMEP